MNLLKNGFSGSVLKHLSKDYLVNLQIPIPKNKEKITEWVEKISNPYDKKINAEKEFKELEEEIKNKIKHIYENEESGWMELNREKIIKFLNRVHMKLLKAFGEYKKTNVDKIREDESFSLLCDKTSVKMMNVDFRQESILGKIKGNMYSRMKTDMKALVEYEFEF